MSEAFTDPALLLFPMSVPFVPTSVESFFDPALMLLPYAVPVVAGTGNQTGMFHHFHAGGHA